MFDEETAEQDIQFLLDTCKQIGDAKGMVSYRENMLKYIRAIEMQRAGGELSAAAQTREAEASNAFHEAITELYMAVAKHETLHAERKTRELRCELFRTIRADQRQFTRAIR